MNNINIFKKLNSYFIEVVCGLLLTGLACLFAESGSAAAILCTFTVTILMVNMVARRLEFYFSQSDAKPKKKYYSEVCKAIISFNLALIYGASGAVLVHEWGHFALVSLIFQQADPQITVDGVLTATTSWTIGAYTAFGEYLGPLKAGVCIAAAGAAAVSAFAIAVIVLARSLVKKIPRLSRIIYFSAVFSIFAQINYALSVFFADGDDLAHDFMMLWQGGIHPALSIGSLLLAAFIAVLAYTYKPKRLAKVHKKLGKAYKPISSS